MVIYKLHLLKDLQVLIVEKQGLPENLELLENLEEQQVVQQVVLLEEQHLLVQNLIRVVLMKTNI
jgi:hypothetical protein